jgi:hypothetical protein
LSWEGEDTETQENLTDLHVTNLNVSFNALKDDLWIYGKEAAGEIILEIVYDSGVYDQHTIEKFGNQLRTVAEQFPPKESNSIVELEGLTKAVLSVKDITIDINI